MTKPWADQPFKLIPTPTNTEGLSATVIKVATEMALAHNMMVRNLNSIYHQSPHVSTPTDVQDFLIFCQTVIEEIRIHHSIEETVFFPAVEEYTGEKGIMENNIAQHHEFEKGLKKFHDYVYTETFDTYNGQKVREMVQDFGGILAVHLADEIPTLLGLEKYGEDNLAVAWKKLEESVMAAIGDWHRVLPCGLGSSDSTFEGGKNKDFPPFPWFVRYLVKYYYARKYAGSWRFSPCTMFGEPKELEFAVEEE